MIKFDVIKNEEIVISFDSKKEAIEYATENKCDLVVKYDDLNFEPLGVVWEK